MKPTPTKVREWIAQIKSDSGEAYTQELCELAASWGAEQAQQAPVEEPELPEPVVAREEYAVGTGEFYTAAQMHDHFQAGVRAGQSQDAKRWQFWRGLYSIDRQIDQNLARQIERAVTPEQLDAGVDAAMQ